MGMKRLYLIPLGASLVVIITICITYTLSITQDHVAPVFPYISETGSYPPESCIFTLALFTAGVLMLCSTYVTYLQVAEFSRLQPSRGIPAKYNKVAATNGVLSNVGLILVASFQESNVLAVHVVGAAMTFFHGTVYFGIHALFSRRMYPEMVSKRVLRLRLVLAGIMGITMPVPGITGMIAMILFEGEDRHKWYAGEPGYVPHVISTISEWFMVAGYCCYILTIVPEYMRILMDHPVITLREVPPEYSTIASVSQTTELSQLDEEKPVA